jgi:Xaa-Pro aminopeptidase
MKYSAVYSCIPLSFFTAPINIAYTTRHKYVFKVGNFFAVAPGYYKHGDFGIRLKNVFEVVDAEDTSDESGAKFLAFRVATLVPFETKLIDKTLLSVQEVS